MKDSDGSSERKSATSPPGSPDLYGDSGGTWRVAPTGRGKAEKQEAGTRVLFHVPIIHTQDDMGSLAEFIKEEYGQRFSQQKLREHLEAIGRMWEDITETIGELPLDWRRVRIYQDGLPVCGREAEIVQKLATSGSRNHRLIASLMERGAALEGTEEPQLLLQEYKAIRAIAQAADTAERDRRMEEYARASQQLLTARDRFIGQRIDLTLGTEETGLLFLGMLHAVDRFLPADIRVKHYANIALNRHRR